MNFEEWKQKHGLIELKSNIDTPGVDEYFGKPVNRFKIKTKFKNGYEEEFIFTDSVANFENKTQIENLDEYALYCHLSDGYFLASELIGSFCEFIDNYGTKNCSKDYETYKELKRLQFKMNEFFDEDQQINMMNELQEIYEF